MPKLRSADPARGTSGADLWLLANHDFRQPAQTLAFLAADFASSTSPTEREELRDSVVLIAVSLEAMVELMTLAARVEAGMRQPAPTPTMISEALYPTITPLARIAAERRRDLELAHLDIAAEVDVELLRTIAGGVLIHAIKHATEGPITVAARQGRTGASIEVCFAGPDPQTALAKMAFVELPPRAAEPDKPVLGPGLALAARLGAHCGIDIAIGTSRDGRRCITLRLQGG